MERLAEVPSVISSPEPGPDVQHVARNSPAEKGSGLPRCTCTKVGVEAPLSFCLPAHVRTCAPGDGLAVVVTKIPVH